MDYSKFSYDQLRVILSALSHEVREVNKCMEAIEIAIRDKEKSGDSISKYVIIELLEKIINSLRK